MDYHDHLVRAFRGWHCLGIPAEASDWRRYERCDFSLSYFVVAMILDYVTMMGYDAFAFHFSICIGRLVVRSSWRNKHECLFCYSGQVSRRIDVTNQNSRFKYISFKSGSAILFTCIYGVRVCFIHQARNRS